MKTSKRRTVALVLSLALALLTALAVGGTVGGRSALAARPQGTPLGTAFTYQGRLTDSSGNPIAGTCDLRFTLYESATGADQVGAPQTKSGVTLNNGYFTVDLDFGANAFAGEGRYLKIEVDCGSGYTTLNPRVKLTPAPYALYAVSTGALQGYEVSDSAPSAGDVLSWNGSSWMPTAGSAGNAWSLTGNSGTTPGTNFLGTTDNQALELHVNGARALRLEPNATSPNLIGGYSGNSVSAGVYGATIGGGGESGAGNRVTANYGTIAGGYNITVTGRYATVGGGTGNTASGDFATVGGGQNNTASSDFATVGGGDSNTANGWFATVGGGYGNTASSGSATVGGGDSNTASGWNATVPGGGYAHASLYGQWAYASGDFANAGDAQASLYVMRRQTTSSGTWENLYLDGTSSLLTLPPTRTLTFDILVVGRSNAGESAGYHIQGVAENVGGTTSVWAITTVLHEDDSVWNAQAIADATNDALAVQVMGNGETIRWVATVRTAEVSW